jgi:hypothetical protein
MGRGSNSTLKASVLALLVYLLSAAAAPVPGQSAQVSKPPGGELKPAATARVRAGSRFAKLPLSFEENRGQADPRVKFLSRAPGYTLFLTGSEAVFAFPSLPRRAKGSAQKTEVLRLHFDHADARAQIEGQNELPGKTNYFPSSDRSTWHTGIPSYSAVSYRNVYSGANAVFHGGPQRLEFDFDVAPEADPAKIVLDFAGGRVLRLDSDGDIVLGLGKSGRGGQVTLGRPVVYQQIAGVRREIPGRFVLRGAHRIGFRLGHYDHAQPLVIDPSISYATFLGGPQVGVVSTGIAVSSGVSAAETGSAYITGTVQGTPPLDFPTTQGSYEASSSLGEQAFVTKLSADGSQLVYSTYLGSSTAFTYGYGIAVDSSGSAYVTGATHPSGSTPGFPTTSGAFESQAPAYTGTLATNSCGYSPCPVTAPLPFVTKLSADGSTLVYSTYLDGTPITTGDTGIAIAVDSAGEAYVLGNSSAVTSSYGASQFPTTSGAFQATNPGYNASTNTLTGQETDFVAKLSADGSTLVFGTYLGGSKGTGSGGGGSLSLNSRPGLAVDSSGYAYISDLTQSADFPVTSGAYQTTSKHTVAEGIFESAVLVVTKFDPSGKMIYSTFLGGSTQEWAGGIAADSAGDAYVGGSTASSDFPTTKGAALTTCSLINSVCDDGFATELNPDGTAPVYSTFLGTGTVTSTALDPENSVIVVGQATPSGFFESSDAFYACVSCTGYPAYILKLTPDGSNYVFSSYLTSNAAYNELSPSVAVDSEGQAYITGYVTSTNPSLFQTTPGAYQTTNPGEDGAYPTNVSKIELVQTTTSIQISPSSLPNGTVGKTYSQTLTATGGSGTGYTWSVSSGTALSAVGLTLSPGGFMSGVPSKAEDSAAVTVKVTDSEGNTATKSYSLTTLSALTIETARLHDGIVGGKYSVTLTAAGGSKTGYTWTVVTGTAFSNVGLKLSPAGIISGTPAKDETSAAVTVKVTDSQGDVATQSYNLTILPALVIDPPTLAAATLKKNYSETLLAHGGSGAGYRWSVVTGNLAHFSLALSPVGIISGKPSSAGSAAFSVEVKDSLGNTAVKSYVLAISVGSPVKVSVYEAVAVNDTASVPFINVSDYEPVAVNDVASVPLIVVSDNEPVTVNDVATVSLNGGNDVESISVQDITVIKVTGSASGAGKSSVDHPTSRTGNGASGGP